MILGGTKRVMDGTREAEVGRYIEIGTGERGWRVGAK